jgi:uncharacterized protein
MPAIKQDRLAFDRASVRTIDPTSGHLHVSSTPISKAVVNPYNGNEIPRHNELGLDPNRVYMLLRDPKELEKAAPTFENKPLLIVHRPQQADDHNAEIVVGAISGVTWEPPYLKAALAIWTEEGIAAVETGAQRQLSCGYAYDADMTPGEYEGVKYDGVMRNIRGNHISLVEEGRAGPDVMVGDAAFQPTIIRQGAEMKFNTKKLSRPALMVGTALRTHLHPKMAADAKFDLTPIVAKVTAKTWKTDKAKLQTALDAALKGKLAVDADISDVISMLDRLDECVEEGGTDEDLEEAMDEDDETPEEREERLAKRAKDKGAKDGDKDEPPLKAGVPPTEEKSPKKDEITKGAMDAAIAAAVKATEKSTIARLNAIHEAHDVVAASAAGKIALACDSAEAVYKAGLDVLGIDVAGVHPSAYRAILVAQPKPGDAPAKQARIATDAASTDRFNKLFPDAPRVKHL